MDFETKLLISLGALAGAFLIGHYVGTRQMYQVYGDVLTAEALMYLVQKDNE